MFKYIFYWKYNAEYQFIYIKFCKLTEIFIDIISEIENYYHFYKC